MKALFAILLMMISAGAEQRFAVHGHRGSPALQPENTIPSFQEAIRGGADYIEMDVAVTLDNVMVISHDPVVNTTLCTGGEGKRPVHELTLAQIRQYDCGSSGSKTFPRQALVPGTRIPTLDEVFAL